jgi:hypothetical protein
MAEALRRRAPASYHADDAERAAHREDLQLLAESVAMMLERGTSPRPAPIWRGVGAQPRQVPLEPEERGRLETLLEWIRAELADRALPAQALCACISGAPHIVA